MDFRETLEQVCDGNRNLSALLQELSEDIAEASKYQRLISDICNTLRQDESTNNEHTQKDYNFSEANRLLPILVYADMPDSQQLVGAFATEDFAMDFVDSQRDIAPDAKYILKTFR